MTDRRIVAVIPARGGSKRLPRKNLLPLAGKPLLQWTVEAAQASGMFHDILLSSDDDDILALGRRCGVRALKRPARLAQDDTPTLAVLEHLLEVIRDEGGCCDLLALLQPTSPLRTAQDIQEAFRLFDEKQADAMISVCPVEHSPLWCNTLDGEGRMDDFLPPEILNRRSQDLPDYYRLNGALYIARPDSLLRHRGFFMPNSYAYVMPPERSVDIDSNVDFELTAILLSRTHAKND